MLKIALLGAPTSNKTELALKLKSALNDKKVEVVDDYIKEVERRSNLVLSHYATYLGNLQAAIGRYEAERLAEASEPDVVITCGTLVETGVYTATLAHITNHSEQGDTAYRMINDKRAMLAMHWLGTLRQDIWDYDLAYYLPLDSNDRWNLVVDQHIPEAAENFAVTYTELPADLDERVSVVLQEILALEITPPDEQTSGDSEAKSLTDRDQPGHVPDLPEQAG